MSWNNEKHKRTGIVTNQPNGYDSSLPHAATNVCEREECMAKAIRWVAASTNMTAVYIPDAQRRAT